MILYDKERKYNIKIYVLSKQRYEGSEVVCVSEDINKIRTSICTDFDFKEDYSELEIWEDGKITYYTSGDNAFKKISKELNNL